jgi:hypothetical protein
LLRGTPEERRALEAGHPAPVYARWNDANGRIVRGGLPALDLVSTLLAAAPNEEGIMLVATGPLEDLVRKHGNMLVDDIEYLALRDERFRLALHGVWLPAGVLQPDVERRLAYWIPVSGLPGPGQATAQAR